METIETKPCNIDQLCRVVGGIYIELFGEEHRAVEILALDIFHAALDAGYVVCSFDGKWTVEDDFAYGYIAAL